MPNPSLLSLLARCFLAGNCNVEDIVSRSAEALGGPQLWIRAIARRYVQSFTGKVRPRHRDVIQFIVRDRAWQRHVVERRRQELSARHLVTEPQRMLPASVAQAWDVPAIPTVGDLADWLWLEYGDLDWFADLKGLARKSKNQ